MTYPNDKWILDGKTPVPCNDLMEWAKSMESANRIVAKDTVGDVRVSTVFLGLDHSFGGPSPLLFETMIFGGPHDGYQERYTFWDDAEAGHAKALAMVNS